jgi:hypothetical protein
VERPLPDGAVLEPGEGCEWIVAFFSPEPVPVDRLREALTRAVRARQADCRLGEMDLGNIAVDVLIMRRQPA